MTVVKVNKKNQIIAEQLVLPYTQGQPFVGLYWHFNDPVELTDILNLTNTNFFNFNSAANKQLLPYFQGTCSIADLSQNCDNNIGLLMSLMEKMDCIITNDPEFKTLASKANVKVCYVTPKSPWFNFSRKISYFRNAGKALQRYLKKLPQKKIEVNCSKSIYKFANTEVLQCKHGMFAVSNHDIYIGGAMRHYGEYSEGEVELFAALLKRGMSVVEVGANIGTHSVPLAKIVGPKGQLYCYEAQTICFQLLTMNATLNDLGQIHPFHRAVGNQIGLTSLKPFTRYVPHNFGSYALKHNAGQGDMVPVVRLDDEPIKSCHLLKIDAEGMELAILNGAKQLILKHKPYIYFEVDRSEVAHKAKALLKTLGYEYLYDHKPTLFNENNHNKSQKNYYGKQTSKNCLASINPLNIINNKGEA